MSAALKKTFIYNLRNYTDSDPFAPLGYIPARPQASAVRRFERIFMNSRAHTATPSANPSSGPPTSKPPPSRQRGPVHGRYQSAGGAMGSTLSSMAASGLTEE